jgi:hypothetical protein
MNSTMTMPETDPHPSEPYCLLTLALPLAREEALLDLLQDCPELVQGYSVLPAQGLGAGAALASVMEQVQGRARRVLVQAVLRQVDLAPLLSRLRAQLAAADVQYWAVPVLAVGRLT